MSISIIAALFDRSKAILISMLMVATLLWFLDICDCHYCVFADHALAVTSQPQVVSASHCIFSSRLSTQSTVSLRLSASHSSKWDSWSDSQSPAFHHHAMCALWLVLCHWSRCDQSGGHCDATAHIHWQLCHVISCDHVWSYEDGETTFAFASSHACSCFETDHPGQSVKWIVWSSQDFIRGAAGLFDPDIIQRPFLFIFVFYSFVNLYKCKIV